jgi:hypothetical protein
MDEREWLTCEDPDRVLRFLGKKYSPRKLRLFAVACCRTVWHILGDAGRRAVQVAESFADRQISRDDLDEAGDAALSGEGSRGPPSGCGLDLEFNPAYSLALWDPLKAATETSAYAAGWAVGSKKKRAKWEADFASERARHCFLLREVIGNPFHPVHLPPEVLTWQDGTVVRMAEGIYEERRVTDLPVLADALEDAGCDNADILNHCRGGGEHVRGCWVIDLLTGRT